LKQLSLEECSSWFSNRNYLCNDLRRLGPTVVIKETRPLPLDAGERIAFVKETIETLGGTDILLYYSDWSVWPSGEWFPLFEALNTANEMKTDLKMYPGILFCEHEHIEFVNYVILGSLFLWDFYCCDEGGNVLFFSNEECVDTGNLVKTVPTEIF
jgi:hypothetical protein